MANFKDSPIFRVNDEYYTPKKAWEQIAKYIPKNKVIWEAFGTNPKIHSPKYLKELGFKVLTTRKDFFKENKGEIIVSNPPYDKKEKLKQKVLERLLQIDKPFILIMPTTTLHTKYYREIFKDKLKNVQIIIPKDKIQFYNIDEKGKMVCKNNCSFYSIYLCYKMKYKKDTIFL